MLDGRKGGFPFKFSLKHQCIATCSSWSYSTIFLRQRCYDIICQELSFDVFTDSSRSFFADLARALEIDIRDGWMPHHQTVFLTEWDVYIFAFEFANDTANMGCTLVQHGSNKKVKVLLACFFVLVSLKGEARRGMAWIFLFSGTASLLVTSSNEFSLQNCKKKFYRVATSSFPMG